MKRFSSALAAFLAIMAMISGCAAWSEPAATVATPSPIPLDQPTPIVQTPLPTPTPNPDDELHAAALQQAFAQSREIVRDMPREDDPLAVFPFSGTRLISSQELMDAAPRDLEWAWREIIARGGSKEFRSYDFRDRAWYEYDPEFTKESLSQIEALNIIYLRNSAMEHYSNMKIVKNNRAQADLDGDGKKESFSFTADRFSDSGTLQIGSTRFTIELPMIDGRIYLCNIDHFDDRQELAILFTRDGTDIRLAFYAYDGEGLIMLGEVQGDRETVRLLDKGIVKAYGLETELCAWRYPQYYDLVDNRLVPRAAQTRKIGMNTILLAPLTLTDASGASFTLPDGNSVVIVALTPYGEYITYHPATDRYGFFMIEDGTIDGARPNDVFSNLPQWA